MCSLTSIDVKIVIGKDRTAYGSHEDRALANAQLIDDFGDKSMCYAMGAARTIMAMNVGQRLWALIN
jgi:hypothetical protein